MTVRKSGTVVGFYPNARGFAFVVVEYPGIPIDWGISDTPCKHRPRRCIRQLELLVERYQPQVIVVRNVIGAQQSGAALVTAITQFAADRRIRLVKVSRKQIRDTFAYLGSRNRYAIAEAIAKRIPAFASYVPPSRKIWNGEDRRLGLFDAAALVLTFFRCNGTSVRPARQCALPVS